jgi:uncharacterized membrane protein YkvA (DUF1232 family)
MRQQLTCRMYRDKRQRSLEKRWIVLCALAFLLVPVNHVVEDGFGLPVSSSLFL